MARHTIAISQSLAFHTLLIEREIARVDRILAENKPSLCCHESPESSGGACDGGFPCYNRADVAEIATGLEYCLTHFEKAVR